VVGQPPLDDRLQARPGGPIDRHEHHPHRVLRWQGHVEDRLEERVRPLDEDPRPIPGVLLRSGGAAVLQILQQGDGIRDGLMRALAAEVDHGADTTARPLVRRVGEPDELFSGLLG
jgi:hypothetical protein